MVVMDGFSERLKVAMELSGIKPVQLAAVVGVTPQSVGKWMRGEVEDLMSNHLFSVADATQVDARWLATGQGEPRPESRGLSFVGSLLAQKIGTKTEDSQRIINEIIDRLN